MNQNGNQGVNLSQVIALATAIASRVAGAGIISITGPVVDSGNYIYTVNLAGGGSVTFSVPMNSSFMDVIIRMQGSNDDNDNGNFRLQVVNGLLEVQKRETGSWVSKVELGGSIFTDIVFASGVLGGLRFTDDVANREVQIVRMSPNGTLMSIGDERLVSLLISSADPQIVIPVSGTAAPLVINDQDSETQSFTDFAFRFTPTKTGVVYNIVIDTEGLAVARLSVRETVLDVQTYENVELANFVDDNQGATVPSGRQTIPLTRPARFRAGVEYEARIQVKTSSVLNGSTVDGNFVPFLTLNLVEASITTMLHSGNAASIINALTDDGRVAASAISVDSSGFDGNLDEDVDTVQKLADAVDDLTIAAESMKVPELSQFTIDGIGNRVNIDADLSGNHTLRYRVYNRNRITSLSLFIGQGGIFSTVTLPVPTNNGLITESITLPNILTASEHNIAFVLVANAEFMSSTYVVRVENLDAGDVVIDETSLSNIEAPNAQALANVVNGLQETVNLLQPGNRGPRIGALTPFQNSVIVNADNIDDFDNEIALYVRSTDARIDFTLPADTVLVGKYPVTISILHQGGTARMTTGPIHDGPNNTIRVDVVGANNIRRNAEDGTLLNFAQVFRNDFATFTKRAADAPWVFRASTLSSGALLLPDGIFNLSQSSVIRFSNSLSFFSISPRITPVSGDAFRVAAGSETFNGFGVDENDVMVALVDNPSQVNNNDNEDWLIIRNSHNNAISLNELHFLNQVNEVDTPFDTRVDDGTGAREALVWLSPFILDHAPFLTPSTDSDNPQEGETDPYIGGRELQNNNNDFTVDSNALSALLYIGIQTAYLNQASVQNENIYVQLIDVDGTTVVHEWNLDDDFVDPPQFGTTDKTYFVYSQFDLTDSYTNIRYLANQTIKIVIRDDRREFNLNVAVDVTANVKALPENQLSEQVQAKLNKQLSLLPIDRARLNAINVTEDPTPVTDTTSLEFKVKYGPISHLDSDYQTVNNTNGLLGNYQVDFPNGSPIVLRVPNTVTLTHLTHQGLANIPVSEIAPSLFDGEKTYTANIPSIGGSPSDTIFDHVVTLAGSIQNDVVSGMVDSWKVRLANLSQDIITRFTPHNANTVLPDNLQALSHDLTVETRSETGWRKVNNPNFRAELTRLFAALWTENRRTFTGNFFDDITPNIDIIGFNSNNIFYYNDPNDALNRSFPGAQSYILNDNIRFRNTSPAITPITNVYNKIIGFDYALERPLGSSDNLNMVVLGQGNTPLIGLSEEEGLYLNIGRGDGGQESRTFDSQLQVDGRQWGTRVGQTTNEEAEVEIPANLTGPLTVKITIHLENNGNNEGDHEESVTITNLDADQNLGQRTFNFTGYPSVVVNITYDAVNNDLSVPRRVLFLRPTQPFNNAALTYSIVASHSVTQTWNHPTTYAREPINAGSGHDDFGLFDPHEWNTEHVYERNRVLFAIVKWIDNDQSTNPEMALRVIVDGEAELSGNKIRLHRPMSDFDFNDINFGNNICAVSHIQVYDYQASLPPTIAELQSMYTAADRWLGSFTNDDFRTDRFVFSADVELAADEFLILRSPNGTRYAVTVDDDGDLEANSL